MKHCVERLAWWRGMVFCLGFFAVAAGTCWLSAADKPKSVWTDPQDSTLPIEYKIQGEYVGQIEGGDKLACQVIALRAGGFPGGIVPRRAARRRLGWKEQVADGRPAARRPGRL